VLGGWRPRPRTIKWQRHNNTGTKFGDWTYDALVEGPLSSSGLSGKRCNSLKEETSYDYRD
jgi:hypothetical protein